MSVCKRRIVCDDRRPDSFFYNILEYTKPDRIDVQAWASDEYGRPYLERYEGERIKVYKDSLVFNRIGCPQLLTIAYWNVVEMTLIFES